MTIAAILRAKGGSVAHVTPGCTVRSIVDTLRRQRIGAVLVLQNDAVIGVVSERDIVRNLADRGAAVLDLLAQDVMTAPVITISPVESVAAAMELMTGRRIRHLPVLSDGALVGLVSIGDLVKRRIEQAEQEASALKDYIAAG
jgi:CBS domain-containing protein